MTFWESVTVETKRAIYISIPVGIFCLLLGVIVGYFPGHKSSSSGSGPNIASCDLSQYPQLGKNYANKYVQKSTDSVCVHPWETCETYGSPRNYIAYHLNGQTVQIDGQLTDPAWQSVPWTQDFLEASDHQQALINLSHMLESYSTLDQEHRVLNIQNGKTTELQQINPGLTNAGERNSQAWVSDDDIRSSVYPSPRFQTKLKVRWDDIRLYIGAYLQETNVVGTVTTSDAQVYNDNDFEVLLDVGGTMHNFKQIVINALGTTFDVEYFSSPYDAAESTASSWTQGIAWSGGIQKAVYVDGTINNPNDVDRSWTVEMSFTFEALANHTVRTQIMPGDNEVWFANFGRAEYNKNGNANPSITMTGNGVDWWSWQPCGAINLLLQNRWGLIQFKRNLADQAFSFNRWHVYKALFDVFEAMKAYKGVNGVYTDQIEELNIPPYMFSGTCVELPQVNLPQRGSGFTVSVKSKIIPNLTGQIRSDRYVFFMNS